MATRATRGPACLLLFCCKVFYMFVCDKSKQKGQIIVLGSFQVQKGSDPRHVQCRSVQCLIGARYSVPAGICVAVLFPAFEGWQLVQELFGARQAALDL
jgi:hypothetical protein